MSDGESQQCDWEADVGLSEETTYVAIYPSRKHADEWMEEANEKGYGSRSKYLYELIQEARAARQEGFLAYNQNESKVQELQIMVEQLRDELEDERDEDDHVIDFGQEEFVSEFLTDRYQSLETLLENITESGVVSDLIKYSIEDHLFELAEDGEVEYKQGYGWRRISDNESSEVVEA